MTKNRFLWKKKGATYSSRMLFVAAEFGNREFVVELIRLYPDLIWKVDDNNQSIFHVAVAHRHEGIYNLLYEIGSMKDLISPLRDRNDNNMLHLVGKCAKQKRLEDVSGVALKVQRELLWFKAMIPPAYRERKNKDGLTPYELFTKEHKDLVDQGEKWLRDMANHCMVIDCLITAMVFAAAYTFPGGYRQTEDKYNGFPVFLSKPSFLVFVLADVVSFLLSCASIAIFSSINTSRFAERDFLQTLPKKLMFGLGTLVLSMMMLTIAFSVSFFECYAKKGFLAMSIIIAVVAGLVVLLFIRLHYRLIYDVGRSSFGSRYLFKPKKPVLYYKNPTV
ncbi:putative PGG domain, ankyrin repeat-containing domain superfamily [Helianthus annuus]|nr:putative PGG domain, ankyrin repeat-containing domain superfamily [Helianthus annuus]